MPESWHEISHPDYAEIHWTYEKVPLLTCNGIKVVEPRVSEWDYYYTQDPIQSLWECHRLTLKCPCVSVFDPDGHLPLLLQRTAPATPKYPFHEDLLGDVIKDLLAYVLVNAPEGPVTQASFAEAYSKFYPGFAARDCKWFLLFSVPEGSSFVDAWHLQTNEIKRFDRALLVPFLPEMPPSLRGSDNGLPDLIVPFKGLYGPQDSRAWLRSVLGSFTDYYFGPAMGLKRQGSRMLIRENTLKGFKQPGLIAQYYWSVIEEEPCPNGWVVLRSGDCKGLSVDFQKLAASATSGLEGLAEWRVTHDQPETKQLSPIAKAWMEIVGVPIIPFDPSERRKKLAGAFDFLKDYIAVHEKAKAEGKNGQILHL